MIVSPFSPLNIPDSFWFVSILCFHCGILSTHYDDIIYIVF